MIEEGNMRLSKPRGEKSLVSSHMIAGSEGVGP